MTHLASGKVAWASLETRIRAVRALRLLLPLADWTVVVEELPSYPELAQNVRSLRAESLL